MKKFIWTHQKRFQEPRRYLFHQNSKKFPRCLKAKEKHFFSYAIFSLRCCPKHKECSFDSSRKNFCWKPENFPIDNWKRFDKISSINEMCFTKTFSWPRIFTSEKLAQNFSPNIWTDFAQSLKTINQKFFFFKSFFPQKVFFDTSNAIITNPPIIPAEGPKRSRLKI